jgi:hypothetical protein
MAIQKKLNLYRNYLKSNVRNRSNYGGVIYGRQTTPLLSDGCFQFKIGNSKNFKQRMRALRTTCGVDNPRITTYKLPFWANRRQVERRVQQRLRCFRVSPSKYVGNEIFNIQPNRNSFSFSLLYFL